MSVLQTTPFMMGSVYCPTCGFLFALTTDRTTRHTACHHCLTHSSGVNRSDDELFAFSEADINAAAAEISSVLSSLAPSAASQVAKDNRVIEESFCERCNTHRPCRTFARQTRSADEGQTIFLTCTVCKSEWSLNS
ncbi:transcription factor S-II-like protein, putative [Bodo saltans]|uniref:Transcription factor S-II-like protein, putative n=1 Tax=Bodo saltans TaxID=75058 RepID=A0A0S4JEQ7_BODSA|nr:transcription factor S-II-like protein, putative [Bodo saltans]|eukprot:CUG87905.1 transcription factor S-II-like protein, putative [Bodo saltans]